MIVYVRIEVDIKLVNKFIDIETQSTPSYKFWLIITHIIINQTRVKKQIDNKKNIYMLSAILMIFKLLNIIKAALSPVLILNNNNKIT